MFGKNLNGNRLQIVKYGFFGVIWIRHDRMISMKLSGNDYYMIIMSILNHFEKFSHFLQKMAENGWKCLKIAKNSKKNVFDGNLARWCVLFLSKMKDLMVLYNSEKTECSEKISFSVWRSKSAQNLDQSDCWNLWLLTSQ